MRRDNNGGALREVRTLHMEDARALKLVLAALVGGPLKPGKSLTMDAIREVETLDEPLPQTLEKVSRMEIAGSPIMCLVRSKSEAGRILEFVTVIGDTEVPGGKEALFLALCRRLHELVGMPRRPEDPPKDRPDLRPEAIKRLAATIRIAPREPWKH